MMSSTVRPSVLWVLVFEFRPDLVARQEDATQFKEVGSGN